MMFLKSILTLNTLGLGSKSIAHVKPLNVTRNFSVVLNGASKATTSTISKRIITKSTILSNAYTTQQQQQSATLSAVSSLRRFSLLNKSFNNITKRYQSTEASSKSTTPKFTPEELELSKKLTWEEFLSLKKTQRRYSLIGSVLCAIISFLGSWIYLSQREIDPTEVIFGLDPFTVYIGIMLAVGCLGFLLGPGLIGDPLFAILNKSKSPAFRVKQKQFAQRIIAKRVDASRQSMSNPVPDYYGEKIGSLKDYRQWLRDCNAYRRKAREFI
ncbi:hypothetical protein BVG19_g5321 [[Candida] boidinii]|nr:hypothetical protein BVG19_g5321 [[Candida] boidinii]OWB51331.1 hypothetical protein B5S27_g2891 [[Candida] boidinii]